MYAKKTTSGRMLGMCYILFTTRPSVPIVPGMQGGTTPPAWGSQGGRSPVSEAFTRGEKIDVFASVFCGFLVHGFRQCFFNSS
jgi:hypothetical protein